MNCIKSLFTTALSIICLNAYATTAVYPEPKSYSANLDNNGTLVSSNELYFATGIESAPLYFVINNIKYNTSVNFTIKSGNITKYSPTLALSSCVFNTSKTQACTISMNIGNSDIGNYQVIPNIDGIELSPINIYIVNGENFILPDGKYSGRIPQVTRTKTSCVINDTYTKLVEIKNGQMCFINASGTHGACINNPLIATPNGPNSYITPDEDSGYDDGYAYNTSWDDASLNLYWADEECPGFIMPLILNKIN